MDYNNVAANRDGGAKKKEFHCNVDSLDIVSSRVSLGNYYARRTPLKAVDTFGNYSKQLWA